MDDFTVIKLLPSGEVAWRYEGEVIERGLDWVRLQAMFNREDLAFFGIILASGDRFVETFYADRWYNIFEIHDRETDQIKAWYCNVTEPANISDRQVSYVDLALDLLVFPDGRQQVLDEDEFLKLEITEWLRTMAKRGLGELQKLDFNLFAI